MRHSWAVPADPTNAILNAGARQTLRPMGLQRVGRSRTWLDDHWWWLIVVEFQPSGFAKASYLNVGICWLWSGRPKGYLSFDLGYRIPGAGGVFESEEQWRVVVDDLVRTAADAVIQYREMIPDFTAAARECARSEEGRVADLRERDGTHHVPAGWPTWDAAVSSGLAGDVARAVHYFDHVSQDEKEGPTADLWRPVQTLAAAWSELVQKDHPAFEREVRQRTADERRLLKLGDSSAG